MTVNTVAPALQTSALVLHLNPKVTSGATMDLAPYPLAF